MKPTHYLKVVALTASISGALLFGASGHAFARMSDDSSQPRPISTTTTATAVPAPATPQSVARPKKVEISGTVSAMNATSWTIDGTKVIISASTAINSSIRVGDRVQVEAATNAAGELQAHEIKLMAAATTATPDTTTTPDRTTTPDPTTTATPVPGDDNANTNDGHHDSHDGGDHTNNANSNDNANSNEDGSHHSNDNANSNEDEDGSHHSNDNANSNEDEDGSHHSNNNANSNDSSGNDNANSNDSSGN